MSEKLKNTFMFFQDIKRDKLYPLLFALDFSLLRECGEPLTDITWEAWPSGPIPSAKDLKRIMGLTKDVFSDSCFTGRETHRMNEFSKLSKKELFKIFENPWKKTLKGGPFQKNYC